MYNIRMTKKAIRKILTDDGYSVDTINSIMTGRRKPNGTKRNEYEKKHNIPFEAWDDLNSYLQDNDTKVSSNK